MTMSRRAPLLLFLVLVAMALRAQDPLVEALRKYQAGDLQGSRVLVDAAVASTQHAANAEAWLLRGFVYKDLYKAKSGTREGDAARDSALASLYRTVVMDKYRPMTSSRAPATTKRPRRWPMDKTPGPLSSSTPIARASFG